MFVIVRVDEREITYVCTADNPKEANKIIYDELLEIYDGNEDEMIKDIENDKAEYCDSDYFAWSNRKGDHDIKAFWV